MWTWRQPLSSHCRARSAHTRAAFPLTARRLCLSLAWSLGRVQVGRSERLKLQRERRIKWTWREEKRESEWEREWEREREAESGLSWVVIWWRGEPVSEITWGCEWMNEWEKKISPVRWPWGETRNQIRVNLLEAHSNWSCFSSVTTPLL